MAQNWFIYNESGTIIDQFSKLSPFATSIVSFAGKKASATIVAGTSQNIDYKIDPLEFPQGILINGGTAITNGLALGDFAIFQIVDKDNILGYGANFVLDQYVDWYVNPNGILTIETNYAGTIPPGLYLRLIYTSTGMSNVWVGINYFIHDPAT